MVIRQKGYRAFAGPPRRAGQREEQSMEVAATNALSGALAGAHANAAAPAQPAAPDEELMRNAKAFEAVFLAQMLAHSGLGDALAANGGFGGEAFSSLLVEQYANKLVEQGGFGLADAIYAQLKDNQSNAAKSIA